MRATALTRHKGLQRLLDVAANLPRQAQYLWGAHGVMLANSALLYTSARGRRARNSSRVASRSAPGCRVAMT